MLDRRLVAVVGASGSGKSSLVRAGLIPLVRSGRLPGEGPWRTAVIVPAPESRNGLTGYDLIWLLDRAPAEVLILRPGFTDQRRVTGDAVKGHF